MDLPTTKAEDGGVGVEDILVDFPILDVPLWNKFRRVFVHCRVAQHVPNVGDDDGSLWDDVSVVDIFLSCRMRHSCGVW